MSLRRLAALAPVDVGYLSKIENGRRPVTLSVARAVDAVLDAKGALAALAQVERAARVQRAIPFDAMRRRTLLRWGLSVPVLEGVSTGVSATSPTGRIGVAEASELTDSAVWLHKLDQQHGGTTLWRAAVSSAGAGYEMLEHGTYGPVVEQLLLKATGRMQLCAGWLAFDAGHHDVARVCYTEALTVARQAADTETETRAFANLAFQSNVLGRPREAARYVEGAERAAAAPHGKARLRALPQLRSAMTAALSHDRRRLDVAMTAARKVIDAEREEPHEAWSAFLGAAELDGVEGTCLTKVGEPKRAEKLLRGAIAGCDDQHARNRALYRVRLARARLDMRIVDGAAEAASEALDDLTGQVASWRVRNELDYVAGQLADHIGEPAAATFVHRYTEAQKASRIP
jgi:tetratricopeptide (TPR) repeat protein